MTIRLPPSATYTGTTDIYLVDKSEAYTGFPTSVHVIFTAIGF